MPNSTMTVTCSVGSRQSREQSDAYIPSIFLTVLQAFACTMVRAVPKTISPTGYLLSNVLFFKTHIVCPLFGVYVYVGLILLVHNRSKKM